MAPRWGHTLFFIPAGHAEKPKPKSVPAPLVEIAEPEQLAPAYESVRVRAVELTRQAGLDPYAAEVILAAVQAAHATLVHGPNMANRVVHRLMERIESGVPIADASEQATRWTQDKMAAAKTSPDNAYGDDEEAIAAAVLAKILSERE